MKQPIDLIEEYLTRTDDLIKDKPSHRGVASASWVEQCEMLVENTPSFLSAWCTVYEETIQRLPVIEYYVPYLVKEGKIERAQEVLSSISSLPTYYEEKKTFLEEVASLHVAVQDLVRETPHIGEADLYESIIPSSPATWEWYMNHLFPRTKQLVSNAPRGASLDTKEESFTAAMFDALENKIARDINGWYITLTFEESASKKYKEALPLFPHATYHYNGIVDGKKRRHKLVFTEDQKSFASFSSLLALVKDWKSTEIRMKGEYVDTRDMRDVTDCYQARSLVQKENYCDGVQRSHRNPFGCHKLGLNEGDTPWWFYGRFDSGDIWHIDKRELLVQLKERSEKVKGCPLFSWEHVLHVYEQLPDTIDPHTSEEWVKSGYTLKPKY